MGLNRYRVDGSYQRFGQSVLGGSPLRLFRVTPRGAHVLQAVEDGVEIGDQGANLIDRLLDAGAIHPAPGPPSFTPADVTVVVPAWNTVGAAHLDHEVYAAVVIVDDASQPPLQPPAQLDLVMVRQPTNRGPGAARNRGLAEVRTSLVAFVDTDVRLTAGWIRPLLAHFADQRVAAVACRIQSADDHSPLANYERQFSPLDLGEREGRVAPGTRISYVPAAVLVCRVDALRSIEGFDERLRYGEDVDLVWRLVANGWRVRYEPQSVVEHLPRRSLGDLLRQRAGYGSSAAELAARHPGALAPVRISAWSAAVWALVAARKPFAAITLAATTAVLLQRKLTDIPTATSWQLTLRGHIAAGRQLADAVGRVWWPALILAGVVSKRSRHALAIAVALAPIAEVIDARQPTLLRWMPLRVLDRAAYGWGVWRGVLRRGSTDALRPAFPRWPPPTGR